MGNGRQTRQQVLDTARELFRQQGYHGTGLNQILAESKAPKGSLYFHFPGGKEQLAVEGLGASATEWRALIDQAVRAPDPRIALTAIGEALAAQLTASEYRAGCPIAAVAHDGSSASEPIRTACERAFGEWLEVIEAALRDWGVPAERSGPLATVILSALEGALLLSRVRRDTEPLRTVVEQLAESITAAAA